MNEWIPCMNGYAQQGLFIKINGHDSTRKWDPQNHPNHAIFVKQPPLDVAWSPIRRQDITSLLWTRFGDTLAWLEEQELFILQFLYDVVMCIVSAMIPSFLWLKFHTAGVGSQESVAKDFPTSLENVLRGGHHHLPPPIILFPLLFYSHFFYLYLIKFLFPPLWVWMLKSPDDKLWNFPFISAF